MDAVTIFLVVLAVACLLSAPICRARKPARLPPGPYPYPLIGNILALGSKPHQSLAALARRYGPVMSLSLGSTFTVVISSPAAAKAAFQRHDSATSTRAVPTAATALHHDEHSMVWLPVDRQWRALRKVCREQMFSAARLDASQGLRREKIRQLVDYVRDCGISGRTVDVGEAAFTTSLNLMSETLFSVQFAPLGSGSESEWEMKELVWGVMKCLGDPNLSDYFPVLKLVDPQGILKQNTGYFSKFFDIFDRIIDEKMKSRAGKNDLVENLIDLRQKGELELTLFDIKHLLLDLFVAGTDTTSSTVEWAMAELLQAPDKLSRVRDEILTVVGETGHVEESDIVRLPYLQAVVKETFRLHPAAPFLVPHKANAEVEIEGYTIPCGAQILVNVWASGRDCNTWPNAGSFIPERFLEEGDHIDYKGKDFELIPFGGGRRICPGLPLAHRMVHLMVAAMVHRFDWRLVSGMEELDMEEKFGLTLQKAKPLMAFPIII